MLLAPTPVWAENYSINFGNGAIDLGGEPTQSEIPEIPIEEVPGSGEYFVLNSSAFQVSTGNLSAQDTNNSVANLGYVVSITPPALGGILIQDQEGKTLYDSKDNTDRFKVSGADGIFSYKLMTSLSTVGNSWDFKLNRELTHIQLTQKQGLGVKVFGGSADVNSSELADLDVAIGGTGNVHFAFTDQQAVGGDVEMGYLYLTTDSAILADNVEGEDASTYTGKTYVGNVDGSGKDITVVFGKNNAFGQTSNLEVHRGSSVWFADKDQNQGHTQTVGGLTGFGQLNLGSAAKLTLDQDSTENGYADTDTHTVRIANRFTGSGDAVFNIDLSDLEIGQEDPSVYEVFFTDLQADNEFTGLITLTGAALTAHNDIYSQTIGEDIYTNLNSILLGATLQVREGGSLKVDTTGEVKNLIFDQLSRIEFSGLGNNAENGALSVNGDLTLNSNTEISIKDFDYDFVEEAEGTTLIAADEGLTNHLIEIAGVLNDNDHKFTLDQDTLNQAEKSEIKQGNTTVAYGTWAFDSDLRFNEAEKTFDLVYSLTDVAIVDGQTLRLDGEKGATTTQDFTALITGAGDLLLAAGEGASGDGKIIEIGNAETEERNSYSGTTTVAEGTTAVLVEDSAFGDTSKLTALGDVILNENVEQTVHAIDGSGNGTITLNQGAVLTVDATESQTINNLFSGTGSLVVDLGSSNNSLIFGNTQDDSFTGQLTLTNGLFSLDQTGNATLASNAGITLGAGSVFDFGSQQSTIKDLTVNANSSIKSSALVIGSQEVPHRISGTLTLNGYVTLTLEDISVATDLDLINYDQKPVGQNFITASNLAGEGSFTLAGSGEFSDLSQVTLDYQQTQNGEVSTVAETVWSVEKGLKEGGTAFQAEAQLKEIHLIDNLLITGNGTDNTLTALLKNSDQDGSHSITFSNGTFTVANEGNNYSGQTSVNNGANVTLATSNAFGQTSTLKVDGTVVLDKQVQQAIGGLSGSGTITLNDGSVLSLSQNQDLTVSNLLKGNGTFDVTLGGVGNKLLFSNENATAFGGTIRLTSGSVTLESNNVTQEVLQSSALVLNNAGLLNVNGSNGSRALGSLTLNEGSSLVFSSIEMGSDAAETAQLSVTGDVTATGSSTITLGGVNLSGTLNILTADDLNGGLKQALVTAGGALSGENYLKLVTDDIPTSQIRNTLEGETVAYGVWIGAGTGGSAFDVDGKTLYATLRLDEIQLAAADGTGLLLALDDTTSNRELSAKLTNYENVAGDITYSGAGTVTVTNTGNDYTGRTYVKEGATVVLGGDNVLGQTALLQVTGEGSLVNLNGHQSIGQLDLGVANALTGKGSLTLVGNGKQSEIVGANTGLEADIVLSNDHTLIADDAASVGSKGLLTLNEGTQFTLSGATTGTLSKQLKGAGSVNIVNSTIALGANNSSFTGAWALSTQNAGSTNVSVEGTSSDIDNALGSSATVQLGEGAQLSLSLDSTETTLSIDEILEGSGLLAVSGANTQSFGFESAWQTPANFAGTLSLTGIGMTVGGQSGSLGANNAANLVNADLKLNNGSILTVVGGVVDTFGTVTANAGGFNLGVMGFSTPNADKPEGTVQLNIDQLIVNGATTIDVALPNSDRGDIAGSIDQGSLLGNGQTPFQTLIATGSSISEDTLKQLTLVGNDGVNHVSQGIFNADAEVAKGYYDFALSLSGDKTDVGILYTLTQVDILNNQTLTLSEKGTLAATLTSSGTGNLLIAEGGAVTLTEENTYTGNTTIDSGASLTANKGSLGNTQLLDVKGSFVNAGANTVDRLKATEDLTLNAALNLDHANEQTESTISAALHGAGDLSVNQGVLSITENGKTDYTGNILLGENGGTDAQLNLAGASGLGSGSVTFNTTGSVFSLTDSESVLFSNALKGQGVIKVNLGSADHTFAFGSNQDALVEGTLLSLTNAVFDLTADAENYNDEVAQKLIVELNAGSTLSNSGVADKTLAGLTLNGGNVDLGGLNVDVGQINLSSGTLTVNSETTIALDSTAQTTESGNRELTETGESLLTGSSGSGGLFDLNIFEGVGKLIGTLGDANSEGDRQVTQLTTGEDFGQTIESLYQDADGDGAIATKEHVANMTRADGKFYYDDEGDSVYLQYTFKEIELRWTQENQGLTVNNTSPDGSHLSATLTGVGNILLGGPITVSGQGNDYTGRTYIIDDANITLATNNALGQTSMLEVGEGASVTLNDKLTQTVGGLAGSGALALGSGSAFTIDNSWGAQSQIAIGNTIQGTTGARGINFTIDGAYGDNDANKADLIFTEQSDFNGIALTLSNINFAINGVGDLNYLTTSSADDLVIGSGATTTIAALESGSYKFNELSFAGNGGLNVTGVTLSSEGTDAVIHTGVLDLNDTGTLSVSANIADGFDILVNDSDTYTSTLIAYDQLSGNRDNLQTSPNLGESAINQGNKVVAYVGWDGKIEWTPETDGSGTVGMSYSVANVQLAADNDVGLVLSTEKTGDAEESTLTALVTDYEEDGNVVHGDITFAGGNITIGGEEANTYHGNTYVKNGTVTLAKDAGFGETALLQIADGAKVDLGSYDQTVGSLVAVGTDALSGTGTLTLGTAGSQTSKIEGTNQFTGTVVLNTGHVLTLNDGAGLGSGATLEFSDGTGKLVLSGAQEDAFETKLSGAGTVTLLGSTDITLAGNNSGFTGTWILNESTAKVNGTTRLTVDDILGDNATITLADKEDALSLSQAGISQWTIDDAFTGQGQLTLTGDAGQSFGFSREWTGTGAFEGTLSVNNLTMTVGGSAGTEGAYNAANLASANFNLNNGSTLIVATQDTVVDTFNTLTVDGGTIQFNGKFGLGASSSQLGQLQVGALNGSGNISLALPESDHSVVQTIAQNELLSIDGVSLFQALITANEGQEVSVDGWTLNGDAVTTLSGLRQDVMDGNELVAQALYDYKLEAQQNALGIGYELTTIDIQSGKTLTLTKEGELSADVTDLNGQGSLRITDNGNVTLSGKNDYSGTTTVDGAATLTANAGGLGNTSGLTLRDGATFTNAGANTANVLSSTNSTINLNNTLELSGSSQITGGTVNGTGSLNVLGSLQVSAVVAGNYSGTIELGTDQQAGNLTLKDGAAGLGKGAVDLATSQSQVTVIGNDNLTLTNTYVGNGSIKVDLDLTDHVFAFNSSQATEGDGLFTGSLALTDSTYHLYEDGGKLSGATLETQDGSHIIVNTTDNIGDRTVGGLTLAGGTLDFGTLLGETNVGQIKVGDKGFRNTALTTINVALGTLTYNVGSGVFGSDAGVSVSLIEGFDASSQTTLNNLKLNDGSGALSQVIAQDDRGDVAVFDYTGGKLVGTGTGIEAQWKLSTITLTNTENKGFAINATGQTNNAGEVTAQITGYGNLEIAGGTVTLNNTHDTKNDYTGQTLISGNSTLILGSNEALGDTKDLLIKEGTTDFRSTAQTIGAMHVGKDGHFTMSGSGSLTLLGAGDSVIESANTGAVSGSITLAHNGTTLELQNADAIGGLTLTARANTSVTLNFGEESAFGVLDNLLSGAGIYYVGDVEGEDAAYVQLTNTGNSFSQIVVNQLGHLLVEDMDAANTALNNANLTVAAGDEATAGGEATLNGGAAWTLDNALNVEKGATLAISAGGAENAFNFRGANQSVSGTLLLTDALLILGGQADSNGAANADVLADATLNAGEGSAVHIATGDNAQNLAALTLNGGDLYFDGTLGVNVSTATLGQLSVESLSLVGGTLHATASTSQGSGGNITNDTVISAQANNLFQNLISITGSDGVTEENLNKIELNVTDQNGDKVPGVSSDIVQGNETVATGTYGYELALEDSDGKSLGVSYTLREIYLLKTLSIVENGNMTARLTGAGNLVVAQESALTLTDRKSDDSNDWNDFTGTTTVEGSLTAGAMTLGSDDKHTSLLSVAEDASFTNAGENVIGNLQSQGSVVLKDGTTLTVKGGTTNNSIDGTLSESGDLILESGRTSVASGQSGYSGDITLGSDEAASLVLNGHTSFGSGTITFKDSDSELSITDLTTSGSLTNLLAEAGKITVTGNGNDAAFTFNASQTADGLNGSSVSLSGVNYDFTHEGSDVLGQATLSLTNGTLTVNAGQSSFDRRVAGLSLENATVDFGTMGPDAGGVIDLQDSVLDATDTTVTFDTNLAAVTRDNGHAAMVTTDAVTLVTNVQGDSTSGLTVSVGEGDTVNQYAQAIYQGSSGDPVAYIRGSVDSEVEAKLQEGGSLYDFVASLTNQTLEIVSTYAVSTSGEIALAITDFFNEETQTGTKGNLTISGSDTEVTLSHAGNTYRGVTSVESGATLKLAKDNVLGNTSELSIAAGSIVDFGSSSQTVGALNSKGQMISGDTGKLTVTSGGTVSGANSDFHLKVVLDGSTEDSTALKITDADALGDGDITISQTGTYLVLSGISGTDGTAAEYDNAVSGLGGIKLSDNASVALTGNNTFSGDLIVGEGSTVSALGDVFSHLGKGKLALSGNADFTLTDTPATDNWTWNKTVTGSGVLALNRDLSVQSTELVFTDASIDDFSGTISLKNWDITLDAEGTGNTYTALKGSGANLTIGQGADATINGVVDLAGKTVAVDASGSLTFTGVAAPGSDNTELSKLTAGVLDLNDGFIINLDVDENQTVNAGALLTQDDAEGTTITVATADRIDATVEDGVLTGGDVTVNGSAVAEDDTIRFNIAQTSTDLSKDGIVAEGIYGVSVTTDDKNLNVSYALEGVSINPDKTLVFAGQDSDADNSANIFNGYIIGEGNLEISSNVVTLAGQNSFTGSTAVLGGAILYAKEGALGNADNSTLNLAIENTGKVYIDGDNVVRGIDNHGLLVVGSWNTHEPTPDITLTLQSDESAGSVIDGSLEGTGTLRVVGNGSVDNLNPPDLKIVGSQPDFYGSLELEDGAWVELEANSNLIFGNISQYATNEISLSKNSLLTINSLLEDNANFAAVFVNGDSEDGTGESRGGRIDVTLGDADSQFKFASGQASAGFNGVFALNQGKLDLGDLYWEANVTGNALEEATLVLGSMGSAQLGLNGEASTTDSFLGGLEFNGGKLAIGSLSYDAESGSSGAGVHSMHVNLGGDGLLGLTTITGEGKSTITIEQNEVNTISADGSELLAAADGAYITLIHNIGGLVVDGTKVENIGDYLDELSNDLLMLDNQTQAKQVLAQRIDGFDDPQKVAEVVRTFDQGLTLGESTISGEDGKYALTVGYTVNQIGLLFETGSVSGLDDTSVWQGLNIVTSSDVERNNYQANIVDGSAQQGNIVFRGNGQNTLTLSGDNTYHGKTWVTDNAQVVFGAEHAFGSTQALRIDGNSSVNFGQYSQTIGSIWALGGNALVAESSSVLTINSGLISGANIDLAAGINITGELTIKDADSLGSGLVTLGNADSHLKINDVDGILSNAFAGISGANISLDGNSSATFNSGAIDDYEGGLNVAEGSSLALTLTAENTDSDIAFGNRLDVGGSLSVSTTHGGAFHFANAGSSITGGLEVHNAHFDLSDENNLNVLQGVDLTVGNSGVVNVSTSVGTDHLTGLTLNDGSTLVFENGATPGTAGGDELAHIDLDKGSLKGSLNANGHVTVAVNVDKVNADWVQTAGNTTNLPLTAQDVLSASGEGQILANLVSAGMVNKEDVSFDVEVNVADNGSYADEKLKLTVGIFNNASDQTKVAEGIYDYKITLDDNGLNLAYGLSEVMLIGELVLNGYGDDAVSDDVLNITVSGEGDLRIGSGAITLTGENSYEGVTTVAAGVTLTTGQSGSALGQTSLLDLEGASSQAYIKGNETVRGLNVASGAQLALENTATLTIDNSDTGTQSVINGTLTGSEGTTLIVAGGGYSSTPDLIVNTANKDFLGDTSLEKAHVLLTNLDGLGTIRDDEVNIISLDNSSVLEISSAEANDSLSAEGEQHDLHRLTNLIKGDGTVLVSLADSEDYFDFAEAQYDYVDAENQNFKGTFELQSGIFKFNEDNADVLNSVAVVLDGDATFDLSVSGNTKDRTMKALTLSGGTLKFGSLAMDSENAEANGSHVNLNDGNLVLDDSQRKVEIAFEANATNTISSDGSEIVSAAGVAGSKVVLIHDIGHLYLVDNGIQTELLTSDENQEVLNDYLEHALADESSEQLIQQSIGTKANGEQDLQSVAQVNREFGSFGYADLASVGLDNALYVNYKIDSVDLLYSGSSDSVYGEDGSWKGLTVSSSGTYNELTAKLTGNGNLVITKGDKDPLKIGYSEGNEYSGRTWVTNGASVEFVADQAFGNTSQLRIDDGATVNLVGFDQTVGSLLAYGDNALQGTADSVITVTGSSTISGTNDEFKGAFVFDSSDKMTGTVTDVNGLGASSVSIGENYTLVIADTTFEEGAETIAIDNTIKDVNGKGGVLQIGQTGLQGQLPIELAGNNSGFSGDITVSDNWALVANVTDNGSIADRLGTGNLAINQYGEAQINFTDDVSWNHSVTGSGNLVLSTQSGNKVGIDSGLEDTFTGTLTVGGGTFDLAQNADKLGAGQLAAEGEEAQIVVSSDQTVSFDKNLTVSDGASLVFGDTVNLSEEPQPELNVGGTLTLNGAQVEVTIDGELDVGNAPSEALDMSALTMADEADLSYVIAQAGLIDLTNSDLLLNGKTEYNPMSVAITSGTHTIAQGKYDFDLGVSTDRTELGLSYHLKEVAINDGETLALAGAIQGETAAVDWANASEFSAAITGDGGIGLVEGNLTLSGSGNSYTGDTVIGGADGSAVLTVESSLGNTSHVVVNQTGKLVNVSDETQAGYLTVDGGEVELQSGSALSILGQKDSVVDGTLTGSGALTLRAGDFKVVSDGDYRYSGKVTVGDGASFTLSTRSAQTVSVTNSFAANEGSAGTVAFNGSGSTYQLLGSAVELTGGTFLLGDNVTVEADNINAIGGAGSELLITTADDTQATFAFDYDESKSDKFLTITQQMTKGITFAKSGTGVIELSDSSLGAGAVDVEEGGVIFGEAGSDTRYSTAMTVRSNAWAAGFGAVDSLTVAGNGSVYVGGMTGYNSLVESLASSESADGKTVTFTVGAEGHVGTAVTNNGTIYVGNKTASGEMPTDSDFIGNELVINGDYVTSVDQNGGILDMNAIIAGNDGSKADHVTITGGIKGQGYIDVNYDETASTGGKLDYLGLVSVGEGEDPDNLSLKLKDSIKIDDLYYALMYSTEQNEYYLMSSVTDPGDDPWKTEDVENVDGATRSALAFMQSQVFDLSLHDHVGETLYVDPLTGEEHSTSFWMIQRGDWTKFTNESGQMDSDGHVYTTHLGTDLIAKRTDNATFRVGVLGSFADGQVDVTSNLNGKKAQGEFRGYSAGLYFTAQSDAESGPFADLQLRWNRFNNTVGLDKYHLDGLSVTAEAGWDQLLSKGVTETGRSVEWRVEPHIRAYWTDFGNPEEWTSPVGETMKSEFDNGMLFRLGARTKVASKKGSGPAVQAYAEANWVYNYGDYKTTVSTQYGDVTSEQSATNFAELRMGFEVQFTPKVNVWVEGHHNTGSNDYESSGAMVGFKYQW